MDNVCAKEPCPMAFVRLAVGTLFGTETLAPLATANAPLARIQRTIV